MIATPVYRIKNFSAHFEKSESRKLKGAWGWVPLPCKLDGKGYRRLIRHGAEHYGAWIAILIVAVKCKPAGTLQDEDGPLSAADIADKSGMPVELISRTLELVTSHEHGIGWLEVVASPYAVPSQQDGAPVHQDAIPPHQEDRPEFRPTGQNQTRQDQTLQYQTIPDSGKSGSGAKGKSAADSKRVRKPKGSVFTWLKSDDLRDTAKLLEWHSRVIKCPNPVVENSQRGRLNVVAAAVRSLEKADDPLKLFAWIVGKGKWDFISQQHEDAAQGLIKQHESGQRGFNDLFASLVRSTTPTTVPDTPDDDAFDFQEGEE